MAAIVGQSRPEEVVEISVDLREDRRRSPAHFVELAKEGAPNVVAVLLVDDLELHADLLEAEGQELKLLDILRAIARPVRALDLHAVGKVRLGQHLPRQRRIVLAPPSSLSQLGGG